MVILSMITLGSSRSPHARPVAVSGAGPPGASPSGQDHACTTACGDLARAVRLFDCEDPDDQARLADPAFVLRPLTGLVILDEIQMRPDLFPLLRVLADRTGTPARFLILGSAAPELLQRTAETLAGRVAFQELDGFGLDELTSAHSLPELTPNWLDTRWLRGGFPRALLAKDLAASRTWRDAFIRTYLERDLPQLGINLPALSLRRFWTMLAHYHGQTWNSSELARSLGERQDRRPLSRHPGRHLHDLPPPTLAHQSRQTGSKGAQGLQSF